MKRGGVGSGCSECHGLFQVSTSMSSSFEPLCNGARGLKVTSILEVCMEPTASLRDQPWSKGAAPPTGHHRGISLSRRRPAERLHEKASVFLTVRHPRYFARTDLDKQTCWKLHVCHPFSLCFLMFSMRFLGSSGHLPMLSENGVAQILHMCSVVFETARRDSSGASFPPETNAVIFFVLAIN